MQRYHDYKLARSEKEIAKQKFNKATMEISFLMDVQTYSMRMYNKINLPKCINLIFVDSDAETVVKHCKDFDKDLDCPECNNCRHYYNRQRYMDAETEFKIAQQKAKVARRDLINEIKNIFMLRR